MQGEPQKRDEISPERRKRTRLIVIVHLLIVVMFFVATFRWGNLG